MNALVAIPQDAIILNHNQVRTSSLKVAEAFGKRHDNVLRNIKSLDCSPEFTELNFEVSEYRDATGRTLTMWEMTKDGFMFLVMGFTGKKAALIKEAYINAFNDMAERLSGGIESGYTQAHVESCWRLASSLASEAQRALFDALIKNENVANQRFLVAMTGADGITPYVRTLEDDALIVSLNRLPRMITEPGGIVATNLQLANIASACSERLAAKLKIEGSASSELMLIQ